MEMFVIVDDNTGKYYARRYGKVGWYTDDLIEARLYRSEKAAQRTIDAGNHHVTYPGNRALTVKLLSFVQNLKR